jgi:enoyl-CoA hydratase
MTARTLSTRQDGRVLTVVFDNPPRHYMDAQMVGELGQLMDRIEGEPSIGAVVLTGKHPGFFVTHYDPAEIAAASERARQPLSPLAASTPIGGALGVLYLDLLLLRMNRMDKVFIAAINGIAVGGGFILAQACDVRLIAEGEHRVGLPEPSVGFVPATGVQRLVHAVGHSKAVELVLEAKMLTPSEALENGLVHHVVPAEDLLAEAHAIAHRLSKRRPTTVGLLKRLVYEASTRPLTTGFRLERAALLSGITEPTTARALRAYMSRLGPPGDPDDHVAAWELLRRGDIVDLVAPG